MIRQRTCPICEQELPVTVDGNSAIFPFCSLRCKQVDLYRWMNGEYRIEQLLTPDQLAELPEPSDESAS
jgi:endogenous inhibitor of DNA gyrase (YacG/DUF329 family)